MKAKPPVRKLRPQPDLAQLKRQAKELLTALRSGDEAAVVEVARHCPGVEAKSCALHDAQRALARAYGFDSWPKLKAYVDGVTVGRLVEAVRTNDQDQARVMLQARPELVHMDVAGNNEHRALHYAVLDRLPDMVRLLMERGADAHKGIYPHRAATSAHTIARERGYTEIVAIIEEEETRRRARSAGADAPGVSGPGAIIRAIASGKADRAQALCEAEPALINAPNREGWTPLHAAAALAGENLVAWMLERGGEPNRAGPAGKTPLDSATGTRWGRADDKKRLAAVARRLLHAGASLTARSAVALGEADWIKAKHAAGELSNPIEDSGGLLTIAVRHGRPEMLELLLELGLDPDERMRVADLEPPEFSAGMPLWHCAVNGELEMARTLLEHGADPNASVYASGSPMHQAYGCGREKVIELMRSHGGAPDIITAGLYRKSEMARRMLDGQEDPRIEGGTFAGETAAEQLLWAAACGGDPQALALALERIDWARDDTRWHRMLKQPTRLWNHGPDHWQRLDWDRSTYFECFRLILERCNPDVRARFGATILHDLAAARGHVTAEDATSFATLALDAGASLTPRDDLLCSTPLGWACRWGRIELVNLLLARGADPVESDADPWATPRAWAEKKGHQAIQALLK